MLDSLIWAFPILKVGGHFSDYSSWIIVVYLLVAAWLFLMVKMVGHITVFFGEVILTLIKGRRVDSAWLDSWPFIMFSTSSHFNFKNVDSRCDLALDKPWYAHVSNEKMEIASKTY